MTLTEKGLIKLLKKNFMELEPIAKDVPSTADVKMVTGPSGLPEAQVTQEKADQYLEEQFAISLATAIAKAIHPQLVQPGEGVTPWFEWNETDLSQFDAPVLGSAVSSHTTQVVTYKGFKWIDLSVTGTGGGGGSGMSNGFILPIAATPPSADYVVAFDFVSRAVVSNRIGAAAVVRFVDKNTGYWVRYFNRVTPPIQDFGKFIPTEKLSRFEDMADPSLDGLDRGVRMALSVQGGVDGVLAKMIVGEPALYIDGSPYTAVGKAGLFQTTCGLAGTTQNYYRNIRCYLSNDVERFEL